MRGRIKHAIIDNLLQTIFEKNLPYEMLSMLNEPACVAISFRKLA